MTQAYMRWPESASLFSLLYYSREHDSHEHDSSRTGEQLVGEQLAQRLSRAYGALTVLTYIPRDNPSFAFSVSCETTLALTYMPSSIPTDHALARPFRFLSFCRSLLTARLHISYPALVMAQCKKPITRYSL
jgi:hypothetical protein